MCAFVSFFFYPILRIRARARAHTHTHTGADELALDQDLWYLPDGSSRRALQARTAKCHPRALGSCRWHRRSLETAGVFGGWRGEGRGRRGREEEEEEEEEESLFKADTVN